MNDDNMKNTKVPRPMCGALLSPLPEDLPIISAFPHFLAPSPPRCPQTVLLKASYMANLDSAFFQNLHPFALDEIWWFFHTEIHFSDLRANQLQRAGRTARRPHGTRLHCGVTIAIGENVLDQG